MQERVKSIHDTIAERYQSTRREIAFQFGDRVWVRNLPHEANKLDTLWTGPCEILQRIGNSSRYTVALPEGVQDIHTDRLKMYLPKLNGSKIVLHYYRPQRDVPEDDSLVL